ncbi:hypothetical protein SDC9_193250 [bioreactor metagenome]|uniref:Uncharacterized protein n=1 Tax=bioreactor metagenome TaxID=1076179 RepID=A0A645I300_9ZZZZ
MQFLALNARRDGDFSVAVHEVHAVIDRVFCQRLHDEFDDGEIFDLLIHHNLVGEFVFVAHLLNRQIVLHMLQLIPHGDDILAAAEADAKEPRQRGDDMHRFLGLLFFNHPDDDVQRVV